MEMSGAVTANSGGSVGEQNPLLIRLHARAELPPRERRRHSSDTHRHTSESMASVKLYHGSEGSSRP